MDEAEALRRSLEDAELSQADYARLLGVTPRAVSLWLTGQREVPGPAKAYLRLFSKADADAKFSERVLLNERVEQMASGMYGVSFSGSHGSGGGVVVFQDGKVTGVDQEGARYDGHYKVGAAPGTVDVDLEVTVPPGVGLVQGVPPQDVEYKFKIASSINAGKDSLISVPTPFGAVNAKVSFLRAL